MTIDSSTNSATNSERNQDILLQSDEGKSTKLVHKIFFWIVRSILTVSLLSTLYCLFSSDRYVSEATILIQNTEQITTPSLDVTTLLSGMSGPNKTDQLLLSEYLLSVDMLKKLDKTLDLRTHYSSNRWDFASRMWLGKYYLEWFHRYYLSRVTVTYDEFSGVLRIQAQAYTPETAFNIAQLLVLEGEKFMNEMSHALARVQVEFLDKQVAQAQIKVLHASKELLNFQNQKGLVSPKATVESIHVIIAKLEEQRTELQTQIAALPRNLDIQHPTRKSLENSLYAVEQQIIQEQAKLASTSGKPLNSLMEKEQLLQLELKFKQDMYKTALVALEKGRMDAARSLKQISILQHPLFPEYALQPKRIYGIIITLIITILIIGITNLLKYIILDHVD